ncbi:MAG TPA: hypothetical protein VLU95_06130, partial [Candidatus Acidoferrum sp.]|nr:hypothetical protein [Candidatus Acidoferrum sp.]
DSSNYHVWYTTQFSTHQISIVFNASSIPEFPSSIVLSLLIILVIAALAMLTLRKRDAKKHS